ncbi:MAG: ATP-dependent DNA helicase RecG [Candidatus Levybacteria bacterium]|nr:ATP-dependent DNA helicase RecG [Candidatus Levybacteria bacterium]
MDLKTPVKQAGFVYKNYAKRLEKLGIYTLEDFLYHIPFRYEDYSLISKVGSVQAGEIVTIQGTVVDIKNELTKKFKRIQKALIADETGTIDIVWFNQPYLTKYIHKEDFISISGKIDFFLFKLTMQSPEYELLPPNFSEQNAQQRRTIHTGRLVPIYPETRGVSSKWLRRQVFKILNEQKQKMFEYLPDSIIEESALITFTDAIEQIHFPKTHALAAKAKFRLSFDELFLMQLSSLKRRREWEKNLRGITFSVSKFREEVEDFWKRLPFELTDAQKRAVKEIFADLAGKKPMNRLLEGDVGSGKTVVSAIAMYVAFLNGYQSVLMAPTEILAVQHYKTIQDLLIPLGVRVQLITGSKKLKETEEFDILVGTHAILTKKVNFQKLGLVVIDEQQRFGVAQRTIIRNKGQNPHLLTMTATPIPRTIALTMYGDLDLSFLDEMPKGRKKIKTWLVPPEKRNNAYEWIKSQIKSSQIFIICPFIEESESMQTVKTATKEFERLKKEVFPDKKLGLLHGKLKSKEKDEILKKFREGGFNILVATPVVEVGIDIPGATIIIIEAAERFGLANLHQLRGRVGRGDKQSYCLLFTESKNPQTIQRLKAMETMHVGAELSELDLKLRGPGEIYGTSQHGLPNLKISSFSDFSLIQKTKFEAEKIFPKLDEYPKLKEKIEEISVEFVSPD